MSAFLDLVRRQGLAFLLVLGITLVAWDVLPVYASRMTAVEVRQELLTTNLERISSQLVRVEDKVDELLTRGNGNVSNNRSD